MPSNSPQQTSDNLGDFLTKYDEYLDGDRLREDLPPAVNMSAPHSVHNTLNSQEKKESVSKLGTKNFIKYMAVKQLWLMLGLNIPAILITVLALFHGNSALAQRMLITIVYNIIGTFIALCLAAVVNYYVSLQAESYQLVIDMLKKDLQHWQDLSQQWQTIAEEALALPRDNEDEDEDEEAEDEEEETEANIEETAP